MTRTIRIELVVTGKGAAAADDAVRNLLDHGAIQELIADYAADHGHAFTITSATSHAAEGARDDA